MPLFYCKWEDRESLLVDADDETDAKRCARDVADGDWPAEVLAIPPRLFVAAVAVDGNGYLAVEPLEHVDEMLARYEGLNDDEEDDDEAEEVDGCGATAEEKGTHYLCTREKGHEGDHETHDDKGRLLATWSET